jgi:mRNA interferase HigB
MGVRVISRKALREFADAHKDAETPLDDWYRTAKGLRWTSLVDVRKTYPHADAVGEFRIFNIGGNEYRLADPAPVRLVRCIGTTRFLVFSVRISCAAKT